MKYLEVGTKLEDGVIGRTQEQIESCDEYVEFQRLYKIWSEVMVANEDANSVEELQPMYKWWELEVALGQFDCIKYLQSSLKFWEYDAADIVGLIVEEDLVDIDRNKELEMMIDWAELTTSSSAWEYLEAEDKVELEKDVRYVINVCTQENKEVPDALLEYL